MKRHIALLMSVVALGAFTSLATAGTKHSGTVIAVSPERLVIEELAEGGVAMRRTVALGPSTRVVLARRTESREATRVAWPGSFQDLPASEREIRVGDFVTVTVGDGGGASIAHTIELVRPTAEGAASPR